MWHSTSPLLIHIKAVREVKVMARFWYGVDLKIEGRYGWDILLSKIMTDSTLQQNLLNSIATHVENHLSQPTFKSVKHLVVATICTSIIWSPVYWQPRLPDCFGRKTKFFGLVWPTRGRRLIFLFFSKFMRIIRGFSEDELGWEEDTPQFFALPLWCIRFVQMRLRNVTRNLIGSVKVLCQSNFSLD